MIPCLVLSCVVAASARLPHISIRHESDGRRLDSAPSPAPPGLSPTLQLTSTALTRQRSLSWAFTAAQLRSLIANETATPRSTTIFIPSGSRLGLGGEQLSIHAGADVTIVSVGADGPPAIIDGEGRSRIFEVFAGALRLHGVLLVNGYAEEGAGIYAAPSSAEADGVLIELNRSMISNCSAIASNEVRVLRRPGLHSRRKQRATP